jgi:O-antigen/teichoic acid export membrane protein
MSEFRKHLTYKVLTNFVKIPVNLTLSALFPRLLGPVNYGNFDFLYDSANRVIGFFDTGSSMAFYTRLSQNYKDQLLIKFYWFLSFFLAGLYLVFIFGSHVFSFTNTLWPNQSFYFVVLSAVLGILTFFTNTLILIMDASNMTVRSERIRMSQLLLSILIYVFIFFVFKKLDLASFFYVQCFLVIFLFTGCWFVLHKSGTTLFSNEKLSKHSINEYGYYFWSFSNPLLVYSLVGLVMGVGSRWILQQYGGSVEQAYFGLAAKIGSFVLLFTSAIMPLLMREFSKQFGEKNFAGMAKLYLVSFKGLYVISIFISTIVFFNADLISNFLGGAEFRSATYVLSIMAFYPVHQSIGQINGSVFFSTQRNREYRNIGLFFMPLSLLLSFFLIAPNRLLGLDMGAKGLALQMVIMQIFSVNVNSYFNCRFFKVNYWRLLIYQFLIPMLFILFGIICMLILDSFLLSSFLRFFLFGTFISILSITVVYLLPQIVGLNNRNEIIELLKIDRIFKHK